MYSQKLNELYTRVAALLDDQEEGNWLLQQGWRGIVNYSQEEIYELIDAIEKGDFSAVRDELADVLFHLLIYAEMGRRQNDFTLDDIADSALSKLNNRHKSSAHSIESAHRHWNQQKLKKKLEQHASMFEDIPAGLPAVLQAHKLLSVADTIGLHCDELFPASAQLKAVTTAIEDDVVDCEKRLLEQQLGEVLMACVCLAHKHGLNAEQALRGTNTHFKQQMQRFEALVQAQGVDLFALTEQQCQRYWQQVVEQENDS